jgi:hypothetical protein
MLLIIQDEIRKVYLPFGIKLEDASIFVGLKIWVHDSLSCGKYSLIPTSSTAIGIHHGLAVRNRSEILSGEAKLPHGISNISRMQRKAYMKGWILRALDSASSEDIFEYTLKAISIFCELTFLKYSPADFRRVLYDLAQKYVIMSPIKDRSYTWCASVAREVWPFTRQRQLPIVQMR